MLIRFFPGLCLAVLLPAAIAAAQERQWALDASGEDAYLVFGVPDTDDVGISFWCPLEQGLVNIFVPEAPGHVSGGRDVTLTLVAGEETADIKASAEINLDAGVASIEAQVPADHPIFAAMLKADRLHVKVGAEDTIFPLFDADLPGLMDLCGKK